jgi:hypothetical protein
MVKMGGFRVAVNTCTQIILKKPAKGGFLHWKTSENTDFEFVITI